MTRSGHFNPGFKEARMPVNVSSRVLRLGEVYREPHTMMRHGHGGFRGSPRGVCGTLEGRALSLAAALCA